MKLTQYLLILFLLVIIQGTVYGQFVWQVSHSDYDRRYYYSFDAISCANNNCAVVGELFDTFEERIYRMSWLSRDGGDSWIQRDLRLTPNSTFFPQKYFTVVQQIDSLNIIAGGDSGLLIRSFDGGLTWEQQDIKSSGVVRDLNFFDPLSGVLLAQQNSGIFVGQGGAVIRTTSDGGRNWLSVPFSGYNSKRGENFSQCWAKGEGIFSVYKSPHGGIYSTKDNWASVDSTKPILDSILDPTNDYQLKHCILGRVNILVAYGTHFRQSNKLSGEGILVRSSNGGLSWQDPVKFLDENQMIEHMTALDRDTIIAAGPSAKKLLVSFNRGVSWEVDSLVLDTAYPAYSNKGIVWSGRGHLTAIYTYNIENRAPSIIISGRKQNSTVLPGSLDFQKIYLYPNPAHSIVNIVGVDPLRQLYLVDMLGRRVLSGTTSTIGDLSLIVSPLKSGIYNVLLDRNGIILSAGKLAILN